ncbi:MAG: adenosylmethionine--8-amino-7-oxononanoate transaminase [Gammaproteobacteria bacterium TMED78]|nr:MAG: adenosylmethionine--8-amino-7-oxononanoate transaminase [Gammaproteobacteria bacterium TMED78]|tara:strand:- start:64889 stop:66130 length:1242 start_codon:yes stop_codon:yes gene_type:complete
MHSSNLWLPYSQMQNLPPQLEVVKTEGCLIYLKDGRTLIDGISSWWSSCHGYNHPYIIEKINKQLNKMPHVMLGGLVHKPVLELSERIANLLPEKLNHVFFSESGSVSIEIALKIATQYWKNKKIEDKKYFLGFRNGYHGDTLAAMSICDRQDGTKNTYKNILTNHMVEKFPKNHKELEYFENKLRKNHKEIIGVVLEPLVQAAGGFKFHSASILRELTKIIKKYDLIVIFDEIATGFGRTGTMFAFEQSEVVPDIITLSKALTGGTIPLAATVSSKEIYDTFLSESIYNALPHGPTYCGNPLACQAANASLDLFESEPRLEQVLRIEAQLIDELESLASLSSVYNIRVKGAIGVVEMKKQIDLKYIRERLVEEGVWLRPFGKVIYIMPPFIIKKHELTKLTDAIKNVLEDIF